MSTIIPNIYVKDIFCESIYQFTTLILIFTSFIILFHITCFGSTKSETETTDDSKVSETNEGIEEYQDDEDDEGDEDDEDYEEDVEEKPTLEELFSLMTKKQLVKFLGKKHRHKNKTILIRLAINKFKYFTINNSLNNFFYFTKGCRKFIRENKDDLSRELFELFSEYEICLDSQD
jgi:hypothetical protein